MRTRRPPKKRGRKTPPATEAVLTIERALSSGDGQAGEVTVPFALPQEEVRVLIRGKRGEVREHLRTSPKRQEPVCQHFGLPGDACGGCTLQHWGEAAASKLKRDRLLTQIRGVYPDAELSAAYTSPPRSRRRAKCAVTAEGVGFHRLADRKVVHLRECHVLHPDLFVLTGPLASLAKDLRASLPPAFEAQATLTDTGVDLALEGVEEADLPYTARASLSDFAEKHDLARLSADGVTMAERRTPRVTLGGVPVTLPSGAFLQATREGEEALITEVLKAAEGAPRVADLFCGIGTFALPLSKGRQVLAAEGYAPATQALELAAKAAGREMAVSHRDLHTRPLGPSELKGVDLAVFDPPRAGALEQAKALAAAKVPTIVAVSCNPATMARDAAAFVSDYDLHRLVMVDQFGWSPHIEAAAVFRRRT